MHSRFYLCSLSCNDVVTLLCRSARRQHKQLQLCFCHATTNSLPVVVWYHLTTCATLGLSSQRRPISLVVIVTSCNTNNTTTLINLVLAGLSRTCCLSDFLTSPDFVLWAALSELVLAILILTLCAPLHLDRTTTYNLAQRFLASVSDTHNLVKIFLLAISIR